MKYCFLATSSECYCLVHILFRLLEVKCLIDELCVRRKFHFILLIIRVDLGLVEFMDSKHKDTETW